MFSLTVLQFDIKCAFLHAERGLETFLRLPYGHEARGKNLVWKTSRSVYGLRDAPRLWYLELKKTLLKCDLHPSLVDPCLFTNSDHTLFVVVYVDDIIAASSTLELIQKLTETISRKFNIKTSENVGKYVGQEIRQTKDSITLHCQDYIDAILVRFGFDRMKTEKTLAVPGSLLENPGASKSN